MSKSLLFLAGILAVSLWGCAAENTDEEAQIITTLISIDPLAERDSSYTSTEAVYAGDGVVGYAVTFLEVPITASEETYTAAGSVLVKNTDFETVGFITPRGSIYRYGPGGHPELLYRGNLVKNLSVFFAVPEKDLTVRDM